MSILRTMETLVRRSFPGFPEHHVSRRGVVVAIPDPPAEEKGTDRFRPRYAVDVQLLTPGGQPDTARPVLEGLPLPASPVMRFPEIGQAVRVGFDYGSPAHPYIMGPIAEGRPVPALAPGETVLPLGDGAFLKADGKGNVTLQTDGALTLDAHILSVRAEELTETLGSFTRDVEGDATETVGGSLDQTILGALAQKIAGDARTAILGSEERTTLGDRSELVVGAWEGIAGTDLTFKATLGDVLIEAVLGSATLQSAVKSSIVSALIDLGLTAAEALVLGNAFLTLFNAHVHLDPVSGTSGPPTLPMIAGVETSVTVKTK